MSKNTPDITNTSQEYWNNLLASEWLWVIDTYKTISSTHSDIDKILNISSEEKLQQIIIELENTHDIFIKINNESLQFFDKNHHEIGFIRQGHYSYYGLEKSSHIESLIHEDYRGKWFGKILYALFVTYGKITKNSNFFLPKKEYSHKRSVISLLTQYFWYTISAKYIDGERYAVTDSDLYDFDHQQDDEIGYVYELTK